MTNHTKTCLYAKGEGGCTCAPSRDLADALTRVRGFCARHDFGMGWKERAAAMLLESAEFIEAGRGKNGDKVEEAGDMLFTWLAACAAFEVDPYKALADMLDKMARKEATP